LIPRARRLAKPSGGDARDPGVASIALVTAGDSSAA